MGRESGSAHHRSHSEEESGATFLRPWCLLSSPRLPAWLSSQPRSDWLTGNLSCVIMRPNSHRSELISDSVKNGVLDNTASSVQSRTLSLIPFTPRNGPEASLVPPHVGALGLRGGLLALCACAGLRSGCCAPGVRHHPETESPACPLRRGTVLVPGQVLPDSHLKL